MKNLRPIRFTPYLLFACMTLFFIGCVQKENLDLDPNDLEFVEESVVQERETQLSVVGYKEIPEVMEELYLRLPNTGKSIKNGKLKYNNVDIDLKEIKKFLKNDGKSSYSFALFVYDASPYHIYNLVMQNDDKGKLKEAYVVGFEMSSEDMESFFMNGEDYGGFKSTFRFYSVDSFFEDSKFNRVGKTGDCGSGTTGGNYSGDVGYNSPGTVLNHTYNGNNITTSFSYNTVSTPYYYNSTIVSNGTVSTESTTGESQQVTATVYGVYNAVPTAPIYTTNVPNGTTQVNVSYEAPSGSGPGATTEPCTSTHTIGPDGTWSGSLCATPSTNQNKSRLTAYGDDCVSGSGTFAINTAAKPVQKLHYYMEGTFTAGHFNWFTDPDHTYRLDIAKEFVWFLIDNGNTNENINFVLTAISNSMAGYPVVSISPLVKYPEGSNYAILYPKLTEYLKTQLPKIADITKIVDAIHGFTQLSVNQIKEDLKWGQGPVIEIVQLDNLPSCNGCSDITVGHFAKESNANTLYLDIDYVNQMENGSLTENDNDAAIFFIGTTILHEYVHYGDYSNGFDYPGEEGEKFEIMVYGTNVMPENARLILNKIIN